MVGEWQVSESEIKECGSAETASWERRWSQVVKGLVWRAKKFQPHRSAEGSVRGPKAENCAAGSSPGTQERGEVRKANGSNSRVPGTC